MAQYSDRERAFNASLPGIFSSYSRSLVVADVEGKMQYLDFLKAIFSEPNLTIEQKISLLNSENPLSIGISLPPISVIDPSPYGMDTVSLKMSMTVHANTSEESSTDADIEGEGEGSIGWGPFKVKVRVKASASKHSSKKRESDYTATTDAELTMKRQPMPETLAKIMDSLAAVTDTALAINQELVSKQAVLTGKEVVNDNA